MKQLYKIGLYLLIIISLIFSPTLFGDNSNTDSDYDIKSYNYDLILTSDSKISNVTLYIPIPAKNNTSSISPNLMERCSDDYPSWNCSIIYTEYGAMLAMSIDKVTPIFYSEPIDVPVPDSHGEMEITFIESDTYSEETPNPHENIYLSAGAIINDTIDTKNPVGTSEVLMPKFNVVENEEKAASMVELYNKPNVKLYDFDSMIYAQYDAPDDAKVQIYITSDGLNEWFTSGWRSNSFRESIMTTLTGPQNGWSQVSGELITGEGRYPLI
ncbi:hypothetical protein [Methanolobus vulcani]|uniref:Uncharacterized protein n=1 Tax=Methanolobus vulcani TaxID=38026 RepID=A0A7Z8KQV3_9EURY|nr:hypothetical protein [Methanolobus vulcani]TQD28429.1 hypothetical protein FKV42_01860 [Methanolobus vulcani]